MAGLMGYSLGYKLAFRRNKKGTRICCKSPFGSSNSGGRIRTSDLRVMSPTSYQAALPRDLVELLILERPLPMSSSRYPVKKSIVRLLIGRCMAVQLELFFGYHAADASRHRPRPDFAVP